jgi:tetratricopeptide (TPR) repeat protein
MPEGAGESAGVERVSPASSQENGDDLQGKRIDESEMIAAMDLSAAPPSHDRTETVRESRTDVESILETEAQGRHSPSDPVTMKDVTDDFDASAPARRTDDSGSATSVDSVIQQVNTALEEAPDAAAAEETGRSASLEREEPSPRETQPLDDNSDMIGSEADEGKDLASEIVSDIEEDDYKSHYDLGMAYIEMALYDEAVKELQIAARSDKLQLKSLEMIGHCFLQQSKPRLAVKQLLRGLEKVKAGDGDSLGIHYNLGLAYEALDDAEKAREHFEEVYIIDVTFRDIAQKMELYGTVS